MTGQSQPPKIDSCESYDYLFSHQPIFHHPQDAIEAAHHSSTNPRVAPHAD